MSYISAESIGDDVVVWERHNKDEREVVTYPAPYYFYTEDKNGDDISLFRKKLTKHEFSTRNAFYEEKKDYESSNISLYESDISPAFKILSEHYYNVKAPELNVTFLDIEVDYDKNIGFSSIANPYAPINSVSLFHRHENKFVLVAVPPKGSDIPLGLASDEFIAHQHELAPLDADKELEMLFVKNEKELLIYLLAEIENSDIICGWNSDFFDVPYIGKRIQMVLGEKHFRKLSFPMAAKPRYREVEIFGNKQQTLDLHGRVSIDYLPLFKKYEMDGRPSYKLESIADEVVPDLPKLSYEGSLADLYVNNFPLFVRYNLRDTEILDGFETELGYVALANDMVHISTALFQNVMGTIKLAELAMINYCHYELNVKVTDNDMTTADGNIQGAYVLIPQRGMHDWIGSIDINSLYPSSIRSINISPETLVGQFQEKIKASVEIANESETLLHFVHEDGTVIEETASNFRRLFKAENYAVSGYGTVFRQDEEGIIPAILRTWYDTRKQLQKKKRDALAEADKVLRDNNIDHKTQITEVKTAAGEGGFDCAGGLDNVKINPEPHIENKEYHKWKARASYFDRMQYVYKIKLNSMYGALNNKFFRFYDLRMGESTTGTGRMILLHQCAQTAKVLDGVYQSPDHSEVDKEGKTHVGYSNKSSVLYGDTDSTYFSTHAEDEDQAVMIADRVGELVNKSFQKYMQDTFLCGDGYDNIIKAGREVVASRGIFVDKKRYVLRVIDNEGNKTVKLKVMGLDTKKTTLPKVVSTKLNSFVERLLEKEDWDQIAKDIVDYKEQLKNSVDVMDIGLPKGVQKVEFYTQENKIHEKARLPGHVAASIHYNECLKKYDDKESMPIISGMKIKVFYITTMSGRFKSIAIPTDAEFIPPWFLKNYDIDKDAHIERLVDNPLGNIIKVIGKTTPTAQSLLVEDLLEF